VTPQTSYSNAAKWLHWSVAGLIVTQFVLAKLAERAQHSDKLLDQLALLANHKSIGMTILGLAVIRLAIRLVKKPPLLPDTIPPWQRIASHSSHALLYGFLFALPISGWLMSSAKAYSVSWFNLITFPDPIKPNEALADIFLLVHYYLGEALFVVALIHIVAALKHHFVDNDNILTRMSSATSWLLFIAHHSSSSQSSPQFQASDLPLWDIDYTDSFINFSGDQAGATFHGTWQNWQADVQFDAAQLSKARMDVKINSSSVFSNDNERDEHIRSADFFNALEFPESTFQADKFVTTEHGFMTTGRLKMKNFTSDAELNFSVQKIDGKQVLSGTATLDRLVWNIGSGDWRDTSWVGQKVLVEVRVATK